MSNLLTSTPDKFFSVKSLFNVSSLLVSGFFLNTREHIRYVLALLFVLSYIGVSAQIDAQCHNGGTLALASDDFIIFNLNPTAPSATYVAPYTYTITAMQGSNSVEVLLSDGTAATEVPYGIVSPFRTGAGTAGAGNIVLTVTPNFGSPAVGVQYNLADPGSCSTPPTPGTCVSGEKTVTYRYRSPLYTTDANNWQTHIPKFNSTTGQTLTKVDLSMKSEVLNSFLLENSAAVASTFNVALGTDIFYTLSTTDIPLTSNIGQFFSQSVALPAGIAVPATVSWGGDVDGSTLRRMEVDGWLGDRAFAYLDPTADSRWVTNVTKTVTTDDDIFKKPGTVHAVTNTASYEAFDDLNNFFIGPSGNIPLTYSTSSGANVIGGGGNNKATNYTKTFFEVEVTYTYTLDCNVVLPVKLERFEAKKGDNSIKLVWNVADEVNFDHYDVEHSDNAKNFVKIGTVIGQGASQYSFVHESPASGDHYYRLRSVDRDETFSISRMVKATMDGDRSLGVYPNPARSSDRLNFPAALRDQISSVEILNADGRVARRFQGDQVANGISISSLHAGIYLVRVYQINGLMNVSKVVVSE